MKSVGTQLYFIAPGEALGGRLGDFLCILRELSEDDRHAFMRFRQVVEQGKDRAQNV